MAKRDVVWLGEQPTTCEICTTPLRTRMFDAKTKFGPWGCLCPECFEQHGVGLGQGRGQEYQWVGVTSRWHKVGG